MTEHWLNMENIKVAIYEDNQSLREVLSNIIRNSAGFELAGEFGHCLDAVKNTEAFKPAVILMDIDMPNRSGIEGVRDVKSHYPDVEIIMHTVFEDTNKIFAAIQAGATGYILKNNSLSSILQYIREVHEGGAPMSPAIARKVLAKQHEPQKPQKTNFNLTEKETNVLKHLANGLSYKMVAAESNLSIDTVRSHIKKIYEKLQVHSVTEAIQKVYFEKK